MIRLIIILALIVIGMNGQAQSWKIDLAYQNRFIQPYNGLIEIHNFSRPFSAIQPLLSHGIKAAVNYRFNTEKNWYSGLSTAHSQTRSSSTTADLTTRLGLYTASVGYFIGYENQQKNAPVFVQLKVALATGLLDKKEDSVPILIGETRLRSLSWGGQLDMQVGYRGWQYKRVGFSPYLGLSYTPYWSPGFNEVVINQTQGLVQDLSQQLMTAEI